MFKDKKMNNLEWIQSQRIYSDANNSVLVDLTTHHQHTLQKLDLTLKSLTTQDLLVLVNNAALHEQFAL